MSTSIRHLPGNALIEFILRRRLSLGVVLARGGALHLPERRRTGGHQAWRRGRLAQMGQDIAQGTRLNDEGDDSHLAAAARADERKDLIDPREQQRPGVAGGATQERFLFSPRASSVPMDEGLGVLIGGAVVAMGSGGSVGSVAAARGVLSGTPASAGTCARSGALGASTP